MSGALDELTVREVRKSYADAGPGASVVTCQSAVALLWRSIRRNGVTSDYKLRQHGYCPRGAKVFWVRDLIHVRSQSAELSERARMNFARCKRRSKELWRLESP